MVSMIPKEYQRVEYLETYGHDARIDTGVNGNDTTLEIDCIFIPIEINNSYEGVFGNYQTENDHYCWRCILYNQTSQIFTRAFFLTAGNNSPGGGGTAGCSPFNSNETMLNKKVHVNLTYGQIKISGTLQTTTSRPYAERQINEDNIAIGAHKVSSSGGTTKFRIYSFWMKSQGQYVRNYIPCVRLSDSQAGFYDTINNTFNPSIGAKDFTPGPVLPEHSDVLQYRRNILLNSPHLITTTSGNTSDSETIAHFKTDMAAPIKSLKVNFAPVQEGSGAPSPDNVRPISGWDNINLIHTGKNLIDESKRYSSKTSTYIGATTDEYKSYLKAGTYRFTAETNGMNYYMYYRKSDKSAVAIWTPSTDEKTGVFTLEDDGWYRFNHYHSSGVDATKIGRNWLTFGTDVSDYEEYKGQVVTVSLPDTFYSGYIDLIKGELVQTMAAYTINSNTVFDNSINHPTNWVCVRLNKQVPTATPMLPYSGGWRYRNELCDKIETWPGSKPADRPSTLIGSYESNKWWGDIYIYNMAIYNTAITTAEQLNNYLIELAPTFIYPIDPISYTLSPQTLKTLHGINNIWSDAGPVEVQYWTH